VRFSRGILIGGILARIRAAERGGAFPVLCPQCRTVSPLFGFPMFAPPFLTAHVNSALLYSTHNWRKVSDFA